MMMEQDMGASADADRATAVEPVPVSPLRDGIPSAFTLMQEFYLSRYYEPKVKRPADNIQAAIEFTLDRYFSPDRDRIAYAIYGAWPRQGEVPFPLYQREAEALADAAISVLCAQAIEAGTGQTEGLNTGADE
jgi:hypothetical protein